MTVSWLETPRLASRLRTRSACQRARADPRVPILNESMEEHSKVNAGAVGNSLSVFDR
jgi:hypothetical protein